MILGYEKPVEIAPMSIYDNDLFKTYIGALKDDYDKTLAEQKEFAKTIGDFYSPSSVDNLAWYDMTMGPIQRFLDLNPDAARSIQGRAAIRQLINSRPYGDMAKLRAGADTLKQYQQSLSRMRANGQLVLDPVDVSSYDTLSNGILSTQSPTVLKSMDELLKPSIDTLKGQYRFNEEKSKQNGGMYNVFDVDKGRIQEQMRTTLDDIKSTPYYEYYRQQSGLSPEEFDNQLINHVENSLGDKREVNEYKKAELSENLRFSHDVALLRQKHKDEMEEIAARNRGNGSRNGGSSRGGSGSEGSSPTDSPLVSFETYKQGLKAMGVQNEDAIMKKAYLWTDKKYKNAYVKKYKKKWSQLTDEQKADLRQSDDYYKAYLANWRYLMNQEQEKTIKSSKTKYTNDRSSFALATDIPFNAVTTHPALQSHFSKKPDTNGNTIAGSQDHTQILIDDSNKDKLVSLTTISRRRRGLSDDYKLDNKYRKDFADSDIAIYSGKRNFIQQVEGNRVRQYIRVAKDKWYDLGDYDSSNDVFNAEWDKDYLSRVGLGVKAVETPLPQYGNDYDYSNVEE